MASQQKSIRAAVKQWLDKLQGLFTNCWEKGTLPQDIRDAVIVSLYKNKGEKSDCSNTEASLCSPLQTKSWLASC